MGIVLAVLGLILIGQCIYIWTVIVPYSIKSYRDARKSCRDAIRKLEDSERRNARLE